jgi:hypothetical protein
MGQSRLEGQGQNMRLDKHSGGVGKTEVVKSLEVVFSKRLKFFNQGPDVSRMEKWSSVDSSR